MAYRARRPAPKLTFKDMVRQTVANFKKSSVLERSVICLLLFLVAQIFYHLVFVPGEQALDIAITELRTDISVDKLAVQKQGRAKAAVDKDAQDIADQLAKVEDKDSLYDFDAKGRRDPFLPFDFSPADEPVTTRTPLEKYDLGQLKLTAILGGLDKPKAIVENAAGKGFSIEVGTKIGRNGGLVVVIEKEKVVIEERRVDFTGKELIDRVELKLRTSKAGAE